MALLRRSDLPSNMGGSMLSDFFDDRFMTPHWMRGDTMPAVNIRESDKKYEVELAAPGYQKSDFNVTLDNGILTVSAETKSEKESGRPSFTAMSLRKPSMSDVTHPLPPGRNGSLSTCA